MMFSTLEQTITDLNMDGITLSRKRILDQLKDYIQSQIDNEQKVNLNFICTHNSRRSHLSQSWAQAIGSFYGINNLQCYSGGTEATELFPEVTEALKDAGFQIEKLSTDENPIYSIRYNEIDHPIIGFSKKFNATFNVQQQFAAIMTCSSADQGCPLILGASARIPITYEDPKIADGTDQQAAAYKERSLQIASELKYVFSEIKL